METDRSRKTKEDNAKTYALAQQGKTTKEIASILGITPESVQRRYTAHERRLKWMNRDDGWTTTPPTEPGWYWVKNSRKYKKGQIELVRFQKMSDDRFPNGYGVYPTGHIPYRSWGEMKATHWLGPLPVPEPPIDETQITS